MLSIFICFEEEWTSVLKKNRNRLQSCPWPQTGLRVMDFHLRYVYTCENNNQGIEFEYRIDKSLIMWSRGEGSMIFDQGSMVLRSTIQVRLNDWWHVKYHTYLFLIFMISVLFFNLFLSNISHIFQVISLNRPY